MEVLVKVLMFGRGPIAGIYGWALEQAGHEVEFYVRPGRAATYGSTVELDLVDGRASVTGRRIVRRWPVRYREELGPDHDFDLIVVSVPHFRLAEAAAFLAPRLGSATVLVFGNVWSEPVDAIGDLPLAQVTWGFPLAGGGFRPDGVLHGALLPRVVLGTLGTALTDRELAVRRVFRSAGFTIQEERDVRGWLWIHFVADAGMHAQGLQLGSLSKMIGRPGAFRAALLTTRQLLPLLRTRGIDLRRHRRGILLYRSPSRIAALLLAAAVSRVPLARPSLEAHDDPHAEEPRAVVRDVLVELRRSGLAAPRLEAAERHLR